MLSGSRPIYHDRGLVKANELPGDSSNAVRDPAHIQAAVTTPVEPNAPHARARAEQLSRRSGGHVSTCRTRQRGRRRIERTRLRGRMSALAHGRSTRRAVENDQHISTIDEHVQEDPPELPPLPDEPGQRPNVPPGFELEGEKRSDMSGETAVTDDVQSHWERPRSVRNECTDETDVPGRDTRMSFAPTKGEGTRRGRMESRRHCRRRRTRWDRPRTRGKRARSRNEHAVSS